MKLTITSTCDSTTEITVSNIMDSIIHDYFNSKIGTSNYLRSADYPTDSGACDSYSYSVDMLTYTDFTLTVT